MNSFDLIVIGSCHGVWIENDVKKCSNKVLLIEPVKYNFDQLKNRFKNYKNIIFENVAIGDKNELIDFFHVLESSIDKLKKHWASGIGSFSKEHILKHRTKRFQIAEEDIKCIKIKAITFNKLVEKYKIEYINKLMIDAEGFDYNIIKSIDFKKIFIKEIIFEKKHLSTTFQIGSKLNEIKALLVKEKYKLFDISEENILAKKMN
jgi:FkbM family methyltransferase